MIFCFLLLGEIEVDSFLDAREPQWVINNGTDAKLLTIGQGNMISQFGLQQIKPTGTDLTVSLPVDRTGFSANYRYFAIRYRIKSKIMIGGLFFTTKTLSQLSDASFSPFPIQTDNQWHNLVVDMMEFKHKQWKDTITGFRLDPTNPSVPGDNIFLSRFGFFKTKESANQFLADANDVPDYSLTTVYNDNFYRCIIPGGILTGTEDQDKFCLNQTLSSAYVKKIAPETVVVHWKSGQQEEILPFSDTNSAGYITYMAIKTGHYSSFENKNATTITDIDDSNYQKAIRFVVARNLFSVTNGKFSPKLTVTMDEWSKIKALFSQYKIETKTLDIRMKEKILPTREEMALLLTDFIQLKLGTKFETVYSREYFARDRIRIGAWGNFNPQDFDEEYIRSYQDCGFDWLISMAQICGSQYRSSLLQWCDKYGIELFINDGAYQDPVLQTMEYIDHPCFRGHFITDEPGSDSYDKLADLCNSYTEKMDGRQAYINLLPMYANAAQFKYGAGAAAIEYYDSDPQLFKKYCDSFCRKFKTNYICTDIYPLNWNKEQKITYKDYIESINIIATSAREHNRDFWCYIQTFGWIPSKRTPTEDEYRWQCYSMLSFGCKGILCWTYAGYQEEFPSLVDVNSRKTPAWFAARPVFHELKRISDIFVQYKNLGAFNHNYTEKVPYLRISTPYTEFKTIEKINCPDPLLIGCFEKKKGHGTAFTLVNMAELEGELATTAKIKIVGSKITAWYRGCPEVICPDNLGFYTFPLKSGEGVFVTVE